ncbi:MAG: TetR family transcriptional regulator [Lachnospiraceae bacterium]|nr:TetR family transcriptional regulator [Lachnospiraceae bacterium]MDD3617144.1 TetR family transcriptional regulator [Lachnospiraceae bacterium]
MKRPHIKEIISTTLIELLELKRIDEISVSEIAQNSGISTRTFYNYFQDKFDLCNYIYDNLWDTYCWVDDESGKRCNLATFFKHSAEVMEKTHLSFFEHTLCHRGQNDMHEHIVKRGVADLLEQLRYTGNESLINDDSVSMIEFYLYGLEGMTTLWIKDKSHRELFFMSLDKTRFLPQKLYLALTADPIL